jgi:hypothetical protein
MDASFRDELKAMAADGVTHVVILTCESSCDGCLKHDGKVYAIADIPDLPIADCTHELGCRCVLGAAFPGEVAGAH